MKTQAQLLSRALATLGLVVTLAMGAAGPAGAQSASSADSGANAPGGPIRLRQPQQTPRVPPEGAESREARELRDFRDSREQRRSEAERLLEEYKPSEFERYVQQLTNDKTLRRFGAELVLPTEARGDAQDYNPAIPPDYLIAHGDEVVITIWGSVEADLRVQVDRAGRINIPRIGSIMVAGTRYADLPGLIQRAAQRVFRNFELSVSLGQLRGIRVYVTGFSAKPGTYVVSSLSTLTSALLKAGGPSPAGSFRDIQLKRKGRTIAKMDLYDLVLKGSNENDPVLQAEDVVHVGALGVQVGLIGSINKPAIFELLPGETVSNLIQMGGGFNSVADRTRVSLERVDERSAARIREIALPAQASIPLVSGDVIRAFSAVAVALPADRQNKRVRIEGEVVKPGDYVLPAGSTMVDALKAAGGLSKEAYLFGAEFSRETVRLAQQQNYDRALRDMELELARASTTSRSRTSEDAAAQGATQLSNDRLLQRLRELRPSGRVVVNFNLEGGGVPPLALEDGDRLYIPPRPTTVGVFGSVFNAGSYLFDEKRRIGDYLQLAGSPTKNADRKSIFVIRADGSVVSTQQQDRGIFGVGGGSLESLPSLPGDTIFVPEEINKVTFVQAAKDWTQILYQLGIGLAAITTITK